MGKREPVTIMSPEVGLQRTGLGTTLAGFEVFSFVFFEAFVSTSGRL